MKHAFSLVELSIVLVILGLLTGGILTGQNLIRAAELRSITTQHSSYLTAAYGFRDKYFALPGDLNNASEFWTAAASGDGDKQLEAASGGSAAGEMFGFWEQLALAGMIEGSFDGLSGSTDGDDVTIGTNIPSAKLGTSGWTIMYLGSISSSSTFFDSNYGNSMVLGAKVAGGITLGALIKPEEAWNIDTKIDDGLPEQGKVMAPESLSAADASACSNTATDNYSLTNTSFECALIFKGL